MIAITGVIYRLAAVPKPKKDWTPVIVVVVVAVLGVYEGLRFSGGPIVRLFGSGDFDRASEVDHHLVDDRGERPAENRQGGDVGCVRVHDRADVPTMTVDGEVRRKLPGRPVLGFDRKTRVETDDDDLIRSHHVVADGRRRDGDGVVAGDSRADVSRRSDDESALPHLLRMEEYGFALSSKTIVRHSASASRRPIVFSSGRARDARAGQFTRAISGTRCRHSLRMRNPLVCRAFVVCLTLNLIARSISSGGFGVTLSLKERMGSGRRRDGDHRPPPGALG